MEHEVKMQEMQHKTQWKCYLLLEEFFCGFGGGGGGGGGAYGGGCAYGGVGARGGVDEGEYRRIRPILEPDSEGDPNSMDAWDCARR